jgi:hypothetical protein
MGYRATLYCNIAIPQPLYLVMGYSTFSLLYPIFFQKRSGFNRFFRNDPFFSTVLNAPFTAGTVH